MQGRSNRERIVAESIQKEISSLQHALAEQIERSDHHCTVSTEVIARDLKYQLAEKELHLEKLHQEVKSMQKIKDDALSAKDELVASHHAELTVSATFAKSPIILFLTDISCNMIEYDARYRQLQSQ